MIDVSSKDVTDRKAIARGTIHMSNETLRAIEEGNIPKGDVLAVARVAAIQATKDTPRILPLCHPLPLTSVTVEFQSDTKQGTIEIHVCTQATWKTGVEMEALTAVAAAALTIYDMCKSMDRGMTIDSIKLVEKSGGRSGTWRDSSL